MIKCFNPNCETQFKPLTNNHRYCSLKCRIPTERAKQKIAYKDYRKSVRIQDELKFAYKQRSCLGCHKKFRSQGAHNRICDHCKRKGEYESETSKRIWGHKGMSEDARKRAVRVKKK